MVGFAIVALISALTTGLLGCASRHRVLAHAPVGWSGVRRLRGRVGGLDVLESRVLCQPRSLRHSVATVGRVPPHTHCGGPH